MHELRSLLSWLLLLLIVALTPASASAQTWNTLINDEFILPEGASLVGHVPETNLPGGTWSLGGSPSLVSHNQAIHPTGNGAFDAFATIDARVSDADIGLYWFPISQGDESQLAGGLIFRYVDSTNYLLVHYWQQAVWLWKMTPAGLVHIAYANVAPPLGSWHWMAVRAIGPSLAVNWDGVDVIVVNNSTNQTATRHGIWFRSVADYASRIGMFRVRSTEPMQPPAVASITTTPNPLNLPIASATVVTATGYSENNVIVPTATYTWESSNPSVAWIQSTTQNTAKVVATVVGSAQLTVTAHSGSSTFSKTIPVTVTNTTAQVKQVLIYDDFIEPEGTGLAPHLPETNLSQGSWSLGGSPTLVIQNQAVRPTDYGPADAFATIDSRSSDADVGLYWKANPAIDPSLASGGVIFRYVSPTSYFLAHYFQDSVWLWKMTPTGFVHIASAGVGPASTAWHWLEIRGTGSTITVNWDGVDKIGAIDALNVTATRHGMWFRSVYDPYSVIGTFVVKGTLPEPVTSVVVTPTSVTIPVTGATVLSAKGYGAGGTYVPATTFTWAVPPNGEISVTPTGLNTAKVKGLLEGSVAVTATATGGAIGTATVNMIPKCLGSCVFDSFTGGGDLEAHTPDTNMMDSSWTVEGGPTIAVHGDKIRPTANGFTLSLATIDGGNSNGTVVAEWIPPTPGVSPSPNFGLLARYVSDNEYFVATYENGLVKLHRRYPGGIALIGGAAVEDNLSVHHTMQVRLDGPGIQVWWDGVQVIQAIDSAYIDATRHGVYSNVASDPFSFTDNFIFAGANKSVPASVAVSSSGSAVAQGYPLWLSANAYTAANVWIPWTSFTWHSSNSAVAFVESIGHASARVVGLSSGTTIITATSAEGLTTTMTVLVTIPESDGTVRVFDTFDGSMHTHLSAHVPNRYIAGATWATNAAGSVRINDVNSLYSVPLTGYEVGTIESGTSNGTVSASWRPLNANIHSNGGIVFRYVDDASYWYALAFQHGLYLKKVSGTVHTTVAAVGVGNPTGGVHQIAALLDGPRIQVWFNGALQIEVTDSMNESASRHGVVFYSAYDTHSNIDDFSVNTEFITPVRPPQPVLPCFNGVWPPNGQYWATVGGTDTVTLSAPFECAWTAESTVPWIHLTTTSGVGDAYLEYSVELNTSGERHGAIVINGWSFPVSQAPGGALTMTFEVLNATNSAPIEGAAVTLNPNYGGGGPQFTGSNGRVTYVVDGGSLQYTVARSGYLTETGSFNVTQADTRTIWLHPGGGSGGGGGGSGGGGELPTCEISFSPVSSSATELRVRVEPTHPNCSWIAHSVSTNVTVTPTEGVGAGELIVGLSSLMTPENTPEIFIAVNDYTLKLETTGTVRAQGICDPESPFWGCFVFSVVIIGNPFQEGSSFPRVEILEANLIENRIRVRLSGGIANFNFSLTISGSGVSPFTIFSQQSKARGTYQFQFPWEQIPDGHYTDLTARWPGGPGTASVSIALTAPVCAGGIADEKTLVMREYRTQFANGTPVLKPACSDFSNTGGSTHFSWSSWSAGSDHAGWAIARPGIFGNLEQVRTNYARGALTLESGYRCPGHNATIPGAAGNSRHMYGDAADLTPVNQVWNFEEYLRLRAAAEDANATFIEPWGTGPGQTTSHVHADWRQ